MQTRKIVALVALVVLVAAALAFFVLSGEPTAAEIGQNMEESYGEIEDYEGEMTVQVKQTRERSQVVNDTAIRQQAQALAAENESLTVEDAEERIRSSLPEEGRVEILNHTTVAEVTFSKPDRYRYEYVQQPPGGGIGAVTTKENVATIYREGYEPEERELGSGDEPLVGLRMGDYVPTITDDYELSVNRSTEDTYVLDLTPVTEFEGALDRVHVDRETNLPVRVERTEESAGSTARTVVEYDYEYDVGVEESAFEVNADDIDYPEVEEAPQDDELSRTQRIRQNISERIQEEGLGGYENVTREEFEFETVEEGEEWLGREVPTLGQNGFAGYEVASVRGTTIDDNSSLTITFRNSSTVFNVHYTEERESRFSSWPGEENEIFTVEERQVAGQTAELHYYMLETGYGRSAVKYDCDGMRVEVYADNDNLSPEGVVDAAENVGCS